MSSPSIPPNLIHGLRRSAATRPARSSAPCRISSRHLPVSLTQPSPEHMCYLHIYLTCSRERTSMRKCVDWCSRPSGNHGENATKSADQAAAEQRPGKLVWPNIRRGTVFVTHRIDARGAQTRRAGECRPLQLHSGRRRPRQAAPSRLTPQPCPHPRPDPGDPPVQRRPSVRCRRCENPFSGCACSHPGERCSAGPVR